MRGPDSLSEDLAASDSYRELRDSTLARETHGTGGKSGEGGIL